MFAFQIILSSLLSVQVVYLVSEKRYLPTIFGVRRIWDLGSLEERRRNPAALQCNKSRTEKRHVVTVLTQLKFTAERQVII